MYGTIYKITNIKTNKIYIGKTVKSIDRRLAEHIAFAESGANTKLARSIRKYGKEAFIIESIDKADSEEDLNQKEIYWISFYKSSSRTVGYNMTTGGDGGNTYKYRTAEQMAITRKKISDKAKAHNSNHGQYIGDKNPMYGKHQSAEAKHKISQSLLGKKKPDSQRIKLSKYYKGKKKSYFPACKYLYLVNTADNSFTKLQVRQLTKLLDISATEVTNIVKNKLFYKNCYYIVESVSTIPDECKEVGPEISAGSKK